MFTKITVGIDGSKASENALRLACDLAKKYDAAMHIVHAPQLETIAYAVGASAVAVSPTQEELDAVGTAVIDAGKAIAQDCGQAVAKTHILAGSSADQILECAEDWGADLIVMGRRGLGGISSLILGSTSQRVSHMAKCACLTVA